MAYLKIFDPNLGVYEFDLVKDSTVIGRKHLKSDCVIKDPTLSRAHAEIYRDGDSFYIKDLGAKAGILANKCKIDSILLDDGINLQLGQVVIEFREGAREKKTGLNIVDLAVSNIEGEYSSLPTSIEANGRFIDVKASSVFYTGDTMVFGKDGVKLNLPASLMGEYEVLELEIIWPGGQKRSFLSEIVAYSKDDGVVYVKLHNVDIGEYKRILTENKVLEWILLQVAAF